MATINMATALSPKVDEKFTKGSQATLVTNNDYTIGNNKSIQIMSIPTVAMNDYARPTTTPTKLRGNNTGNIASPYSRYGEIEELGNNLQTLTMTKDRSWTFAIDKANKIQSQMLMDAGKAASRQISQVVIPEFDTYVFKKLAIAACANGTAHSSVTAASDATTAYADFLAGQEVLGNSLVPDEGRVALCSYKYANLLKQSESFVRYGDVSQEMLRKGIIGEVDGVKLVMVPASRLPSGCDFILTHPIATIAPKQLDEYKIHEDAPGISGWLVEGRILYDCFVLDNKKDAIYYKGSSKITA